MCFFWRKKKTKKEEVKQVENTNVETKEVAAVNTNPEKGADEKKTKKNTTTKSVKSQPSKPASKKEPAPVAEEVKEKVVTNKVYHVSLRKTDGKWQVKYGGGKKAIKLFNTQAEAIAFAEERAESQDGSISIHKKDGKIRKQDYSKKKEEK